MGKAIFHAQSSAKVFGGKAKDYLDIHEFLDSSREAFGDLRHRALTHTSWFIGKVIERVFGRTIKNSDGKHVSVKEIAEYHVLEDFGMRFIPSAQDYLAEIELHDWMDNAKDGATPPSRRKVKTPDGTAREKKPRRRIPSLRSIPSKRRTAIFRKALKQLESTSSFSSRACAGMGRGVAD